MPELSQIPRFKRSIDFAALPTAILCTRLFVASTLQMWGARFLEADAERLAVELVRHSSRRAGSCGCWALSEPSEVWDNVEEPAKDWGRPSRRRAGWCGPS